MLQVGTKFACARVEAFYTPAQFEACVGWGAIQKEEIFAGLDQTSTLWF